jgi:hypothetical protein
MQYDHMKMSLERLGIPPDDFRVLKLLPLIYVAWADGNITTEQKQRIHDFAMRNYDLSPAGIAVLNRWLSRRPSHAYVAEGLRDIYRLALAPDDIEVDFSELPALLSYAEALGRSTARALDRPDGISESGDAALEEVARALHIDHGESWAKLLNELGERKDDAGRAVAN